jgi:tRNA (guanine-N7-)-methyltransferase
MERCAARSDVPESRTYIRRQGRITRAQAAALGSDLERIRVRGDAPIDELALFGRGGPLVLEIGFGMGQALLAHATANPSANCIGAEIYRPGIGSLARAVRELDVRNVRIFEGDARYLVGALLADDSVSLAMVYFPDPWPKKRHHKRRLIAPDFVALLARKLAPGGRWLLATDWQDYAHAMMAALEAEPLLENAAGPGRFAMPSRDAPTRFEARGTRLGHRVWDLTFARRSS